MRVRSLVHVHGTEQTGRVGPNHRRGRDNGCAARDDDRTEHDEDHDHEGHDGDHDRTDEHIVADDLGSGRNGERLDGDRPRVSVREGFSTLLSRYVAWGCLADTRSGW